VYGGVKGGDGKMGVVVLSVSLSRRVVVVGYAP